MNGERGIFGRLYDVITGVDPSESEEAELSLPIQGEAALQGREISAGSQINVVKVPNTGAIIQSARVSATGPRGIALAAQIREEMNGNFGAAAATVEGIDGTITGGATISVGTPLPPINPTKR